MNPKHWSWDNLNECIEEIEKKGYHHDRWSCGVTKRIQPGDRVFLMRLGSEPRGIIASGWSISEVYEDTHWDKKAREEGKKARFIHVQFEVILKPEERIFPINKLNSSIYKNMNCNPQASGITIPKFVAIQLEKDWQEFLSEYNLIKYQMNSDEKELMLTYAEGKRKQILINIYERNLSARQICIEYYGLNCSVCEFNFERIYGEIGKNFIHVYHLVPLSDIGNEYTLNPIKDLRPICPNCHAMIHKRIPAYSIEELKSLIKNKYDNFWLYFKVNGKLTKRKSSGIFK
jgi:5-methylcytosine-specific restriction protein A